MFTALGIGVRKNADNTVTVKVQILDDRDQRVVSTDEYKGPTLMAVKAKIQADLETMRVNETDATLNAAVVGQVLGSV